MINEKKGLFYKMEQESWYTYGTTDNMPYTLEGNNICFKFWIFRNSR